MNDQYTYRSVYSQYAVELLSTLIKLNFIYIR